MHRHRRVAILAEGCFSAFGSKTATGVIRYSPNDTVAVIDSTRAGLTVQEVLGCGGATPVVATIEETLPFKPEVLVIGIAPSGGQLPDELRRVLLSAISHGMEIWNGLHCFLCDDLEIAGEAEKHGVRIWDVRRPRPDLVVGAGLALGTRAFVVLTVGSDCNVGKMTTVLEMQKLAGERGYDARFVATGQTGILIEGEGTPLDAVPGDFMSGEVERLVMECDADGADLILVEGQGSIMHPGFGAVTLGLMLGSMADAYVLCHVPTRTDFRPEATIAIPPLKMVISQYENLMEYYKAPKILGIALNTCDMTGDEAHLAIVQIGADTGLPACDPVRTGVAALLDAIEPAMRMKLRK